MFALPATKVHPVYSARALQVQVYGSEPERRAARVQAVQPTPDGFEAKAGGDGCSIAFKGGEEEGEEVFPLTLTRKGVAE